MAVGLLGGVAAVCAVCGGVRSLVYVFKRRVELDEECGDRRRWRQRYEDGQEQEQGPCRDEERSLGSGGRGYAVRVDWRKATLLVGTET